jgi:hypothetical protein
VGQKDKTTKILESYPDVFADIVNVLLFDGEEIITPDTLEDRNVVDGYKNGNTIHELERDVLKHWTKGSIRISSIGLENQTDVDKDMPLRVIGYDGAEYRGQMYRDKEAENPRFPVVTLVLYFGYDRRWKKPTTLVECLNIPEPLRKYVSDYKINVFEIAFLPDETVKKFKSDFKYVADYFVQMRKNDEYEPSAGELAHVKETLQLLRTVSGDSAFEDAVKVYYEENSLGRRYTAMSQYYEEMKRKNKEDGENKAMLLAETLISLGRSDEVAKANKDHAFRNELYKEFNIQ